jgi:seryl-tRNA synthetase
MLSIQKIRDDKSFVQKELLKKDKSISLDNIVKSDSELRDLTKKLNDLQSEQNKKSKEIGSIFISSGFGLYFGKLKSKKSDDKSIFEDLKKLSNTIKELEHEQRTKSQKLKDMLLQLPNMPHKSVPIGESPIDNVISKECSSKKKLKFQQNKLKKN